MRLPSNLGLCEPISCSRIKNKIIVEQRFFYFKLKKKDLVGHPWKTCKMRSTFYKPYTEQFVLCLTACTKLLELGTSMVQIQLHTTSFSYNWSSTLFMNEFFICVRGHFYGRGDPGRLKHGTIETQRFPRKPRKAFTSNFV